MDTSNKWHSGSPAVGGQWLFKVALQPDELITSWLLRVALRHYCDPMSLTGSIWPDWRVWTIDPDRRMPQDRLASLSALSGIPIESFQRALLKNIAHVVYGTSQKPLPNGTWTWILSLGKRNRKHYAGMQVCTDCLASDTAYLRISWRLAWHTHCHIHGKPLIQRCPNCQHLIQQNYLVAQDATINRCTVCKSLLGAPKDRHNINAKRSSLALEFQSKADNVISTGYGSYNHTLLQSNKWFEVARFFTLLLRNAAEERNTKLTLALQSLGIPKGAMLIPSTASHIEHLPTAERIRLFEGVAMLMTTPSETLKSTLTKYSVRHFTFDDRNIHLPEYLKQTFKMRRKCGSERTKGPCKPNKRAHRSKRQVKTMWARLLRRARLDEAES